MYEQLKAEFQKPMDAVGLSFVEEYSKVLTSFEGIEFDNPSEAYKAFKDVLQAILDGYVKTQPTTKAGNIFRKIGKVLLFIFPFISKLKINKNESNKNRLD